MTSSVSTINKISTNDTTLISINLIDFGYLFLQICLQICLQVLSIPIELQVLSTPICLDIYQHKYTWIFINVDRFWIFINIDMFGYLFLQICLQVLSTPIYLQVLSTRICHVSKTYSWKLISKYIRVDRNWRHIGVDKYPSIFVEINIQNISP